LRKNELVLKQGLSKLATFMDNVEYRDGTYRPRKTAKGGGTPFPGQKKGGREKHPGRNHPPLVNDR